MAKENSYNVLQKPTAKRGRNAFNLNNQHAYSMRAGLLQPVKAIHFMPGDFLKIKAKDFSITFPMNAAPFLRMRKEFSFYSVYYSAVWSLFNQYMGGRQDPKTSAFGPNPRLVEPRMNLLTLYSMPFNQFGCYLFLEYYVPYVVRLININEEYGFTDEELQIVIDNARQTFLDDEFSSAFAYSTVARFGEDNVHVIEYDMFDIPVVSDVPLPIRWSAFNPTTWEIVESDNVHNSRIYQDVVGHYRWSNQLRKLDMLGYGNLYPLFNKNERNIITAYDNFDVDGGYLAITSALNVALVDIMWKMANMFCTWDYNTNPVPTEAQITSYKTANLYPICGWNLIFYHFFRNSFYDNDYLPNDYNLDFYSASGSDNPVLMWRNFSARFLDCEYHQWKKDMFTSVLPDEQFGAVSSISLNGVTGNDNGRWDYGVNVVGFNTSSGNMYYKGDDKNFAVAGSRSISHDHQVDVSFDMIALKRAEMLQEYRQTLLRAGNKTSDIFRALYGGAPSSEHLDDIIPRFLETFGEDMVVDPVISTANTEQGANGKLGDISARGKASGQSNEFKFDAGNNFGMIICMCYVVPTSMYNSYMLDKHILELTPEQHFIPNFENCGLEDVYTDELNMLIAANNVHSLGKQARYYHKKTDVDKVHGAFCAMIAANVMNERVPNPSSVDALPTYFGEFNHWITARTDMQARAITTKRDFYINPSVLDNIFVQAVGADQAKDQFICTTLIEVDATKEISKTGYVNFV